MKKSSDHSKADEKAAAARVAEIKAQFRSIAVTLRQLVADLDTPEGRSSKTVVSKLMELQTSHLAVIKAEEAFHEKFKSVAPESGPDLEQTRIDIGRKLDRLRAAMAAEDISKDT